MSRISNLACLLEGKSMIFQRFHLRSEKEILAKSLNLSLLQEFCLLRCEKRLPQEKMGSFDCSIKNDSLWKSRGPVSSMR